MRERLLQNPIQTRRLRQLLVFTALLFVPQLAGAQGYGLFIGNYKNGTEGVSVNSTNYSNITDPCITSGKVSFELATRTLTLENATINGTIHSYGDLNIKLVGDNYINSVDSSAIISDITSNAPNIIFKGTGRLIATPYSNTCLDGFNAPSYEDGQTLLLGTLARFFVIGKNLFDGGNDHISTAEDLKKLSVYVNNGYLGASTLTITLDNDINCSSLGTIEPIGYSSTHPFTASFNGNNKTISKLTVSGTNEAGLFGVIQNGSVSNLTLVNCSITGGNYAGAIAGKGPGDGGSITDVHVKGATTVTATTAGAIVGHLPSGNVTQSYYDYTVTTTSGGNTSSGYTPRAVGTDDVNLGGVGGDHSSRALYTKELSASIVTYGALETYYPTQNDYTDNHLFAPGQTAYVKATPETGFEVSSVSVTYTENSTLQTITPVLDTQWSGNGYYVYSFTMPDAAATATATFASSSGIIVAGHAPAADGSITGTGITGTVSFAPATASTPNTLTLNGATITGQIISSLGDLTIFLTGATTLKASGSETSLIHSTNDGILSFDTDPTARGSLEFIDNTGKSVFAGEPISGFTSKTYANGIEYDATNKKIGVISYDVVVDGQDITSATKTDVMNDGKITYDSENRILTLNDGANVPYLGINVTSSSDLTIVLDGTINVTGSTYAFNTNGGKLNFEKATGATSVNLTAKCGLGGTPISFDFITLGSGLYWKPIDSETTVITTDPDFLIVGNQVMTDATTITSTGTITYDSTNKVLTIDGFSKTDNSDPSYDPVPQTYIKSGIVGLTVKLKGNNEINYSRNAYIFEAMGTEATILFDGTEGGDLNMETNSNNQPFSGFAGITYNKLAYWNTSDKHHTIQEPIAPEMEEENNTVKLTKPYADGSIKYSIVYADGTAGVSDGTYSAPFAMAAPGTVTAWVEVNNVTTSTVKGKYFGYKDAPFTMLDTETKTPELIPAIEAGDNIGIATSEPYKSSDTGVATFEGGVIAAVKVGTTTLTTTLQTTGVAQNVVILNPNKKFETVVTVEKSIDNMIRFVGNTQYATFCNTDEDDLTLPVGITAYAVKIPTSGNIVNLTPIGFIPGTVDRTKPVYTAILLMRDNVSTTNFGTVTKYVRQSGDIIPSNENNDLVYTPSDKLTDGKQYILYKNEFVKATGTISASKCYLESTTANHARGFVIGEGNDDSTAIDATLLDDGDTNNGEWYDLQGRRIKKPTKAGLYIKNGKKTVINEK